MLITGAVAASGGGGDVVVAGGISVDDSILSSAGGTGAHSIDSSTLEYCGDDVGDDIVVVSATIGLEEHIGVSITTGSAHANCLDCC